MIKWIAALLMIIDHIGVFFEHRLSLDVYFILRGIGRLSFPLFVYLLTIGVGQTKSLSKYTFRLFSVGCLSHAIIQHLQLNFPYGNVLFAFTAYLLVYRLWDYLNEIGASTGLKIASWAIVLPFLYTFFPNVEYGFAGLILFLGLLVIAETSLDRTVKRWLAVQIIFTTFALDSILLRQSPFDLQILAIFAGFLMFRPHLDKRILNASVEKWIFYFLYPFQWIVFHLISY